MTTVTVIEPEATPEPETPPPGAELTAELAVAAAATAVALVEGQAALANQQAAEIVAENETAVENLEEQGRVQDRSIEALWQSVEHLTTELAPMRETLASLTVLLTPPPPPSNLEGAELDPLTMIEPSTPPDTSEEIASTPTELSESERQSAERPVRERRRILI